MRARSLLYRRELIVKKVAATLNGVSSERKSSQVGRTISRGLSVLGSTISPTLDGVTLDEDELHRVIKVWPSFESRHYVRAARAVAR